jgi:hypothetical protein
VEGSKQQVASVDPTTSEPDSTAGATKRLSSAFAKKVAKSNEESESCKKAKRAVSRYAFSNIETKSCRGKIYRFIATRDGKHFSIKVSAGTGEVLEVFESSPQDRLVR